MAGGAAEFGGVRRPAAALFRGRYGPRYDHFAPTVQSRLSSSSELFDGRGRWEVIMPGDGVVLWGIGTVRTHRPQWLARELGIESSIRGTRCR